MPDVTATWGQAPDSLPTLSKRDLLKRYRSRVDGVKSYREQEGYEKTWNRVRDIYRLRQFDSVSDDDRLVVAVAFATINVIEPSIVINHPKISILPVQEEHEDQATIAESAVNYWWKHYDFQKSVRRATKDYLIYGHGWLKVGYRYIEIEEEVDDATLESVHKQLSEQADTFAAQNPDMAGDLPSDEDIARSMPTTMMTAVEDRPFVERVSPFDVFVDPEATSMDDARWLCQRVVRPIEEVKSDPRYRPSVRNKLESDGSVVWHNERNRNNIDGETGRITLWEFYDVVRKTMCVFTEQGDGGFLIDPVPFPYTYGLPFEMIRDNDVPDQFYPIGELEALEPLQQELNETRSSMIRARKKDSIRKYLAHDEAFTAQGIQALRSDNDNEVVLVEQNTPLDQAIIPLGEAPVNAELYRHSDVVLNDFDRVSGVTEYQRGEMPDTRRTATEATIIQDAANSRAADKLDTVEHAVAGVARKVLQLAQAYITGEQTLRKTGVDGTSVWGTFTRDDIQGEFDFSVEAGSMKPMNDSFRRQQATMMMQTMAPFLDAGVIDARALAEHVLREGFGIKNANKYITPAPPPDQQQPPDEKLIETMAYKDAPPDIQRQMEEQAGFKPSALGMMPTATHEAASTQAAAPPPPPAPGPPSG